MKSASIANPVVTSTYNSNDTTVCESSSSSLLKKVPSLSNNKFLFKIGPLRFDVHGTTGIVSSGLLLYALFLVVYHQYQQQPKQCYMSDDNNCYDEQQQKEASLFKLPIWLGLSIVVSSLMCSIGSYPLLPQAPMSTPILPWIIPPHREAFRRTIAITGYLNIRLLQQMGGWDLLSSLLDKCLQLYDNTSQLDTTTSRLVFAIGIFFYAQWFFFPRKWDLKNGNTWTFVLPMWLGFTSEALHQFPSSCSIMKNTPPEEVLPMLNNTTISQASLKLLERFLFYTNNDTELVINTNDNFVAKTTCEWEKVDIWNATIVNVPYLLLTLYCSLTIAFFFTLSFRGIMNIYFCYWFAVIVVGALSVRLYTATTD